MMIFFGPGFTPGLFLHIIYFCKQRIKTKPYIAAQNKTLGVPSNRWLRIYPF